MFPRVAIALTLFALALPAAALPAGGDGAYYQFLEEVYNRYEKPLQDYLVGELELFLAAYPQSGRAGDALYLLGRSYEDAGRRHQALAVYAKLACLHPAHERRGAALESLREILTRDKAYADQRAELERMIDAAATATGSADRHYAYLELLTRLDARRLHERLLAEDAAFRRAYPADARLAHLDLWEAVSWANAGKEREAALAFRKFALLHPDDPSMPYARYTRAELLGQELREYQEAADILERLVLELPGNKYAPKALYLLADIQRRRLKDPAAALGSYATLLEHYREFEEAPLALLAIAEIQQKDLDRIPAAVATLKEFAATFPGDARGIEALREAGELQERKLKDYVAAAATYASVADRYPDAPDAAELLLRAGKLHEDKAGDLAIAAGYYRRALERYPGSEKREELSKRLDRVEGRR